MNADMIARLSRTLLQVIGTAIATKYAIDQAYVTAIVGALVTIITTLYTIQASRKAGGNGGSTLQFNPLAMVLGLIIVAGMLSGCSRSILDNPNLAAGVNQAVNGTKTAARTANVALDKICANYETVDAAFVLITAFAGSRIPQAYLDAEADAVKFLAGLCANRPSDANEALKAAQQAYGTITSIRDRFKK